MHLVPATVVALVAGSAAGIAAQGAPRPTPPPGGFGSTVEFAVPVTYSDGYLTYGTMRLPTETPPAAGWPLVVHVHALGGSRFDDLAFQDEVAAQGYAVWSYDVRGQGQAVAANPGHANGGTTLWGPVERHDLAEQIAFVAAAPAWSGVVDAARVAVVGRSQGGGHAWLAAAWSGRPIQAPGRTAMTFPPVRCALAFELVADAIDDWLRGGAMFSSWWVEAIAGSYQAIPFDPAFVADCRAAFVTEDPAALAAALSAQQRDLGALLATSSVPVLFGHAYFDTVCGPVSALERLESLPAPRRALLGTIGHGVPFNGHERAARDVLALRWLHRFLWDTPNEVDLEAPHVLAAMPFDAARRDDPTHVWSRHHLGALTPPAAAERFYLHDDGTLGGTAPSAPQIPLVVTQVIDPAATQFRPTDYLDQPAVRDVAAVLAACPLDEQVFSTTVPDELSCSRSALLHLRVVPHDPAWMLAALLTIEPVGGDEVLLASRAIASRTSVPGVAEEHDVRLPPIAVRVPAGATLRIRLRNLWLREFPMARTLEVAPLFTDFAVDVVPGGEPDGSWLELPLAPTAPRLVLDRTTLDLASPQPIAGRIRGGAARAGFPYFALVGISGQEPATAYLNDVVPIEADWLAIASVASTGGPFFQGFLGFLDASAEATCTLDLSSAAPLPQFLNGVHLTVAAFVWDGPWAPTGAASNPADLLLR